MIGYKTYIIDDNKNLNDNLINNSNKLFKINLFDKEYKIYTIDINMDLYYRIKKVQKINKNLKIKNIYFLDYIIENIESIDDILNSFIKK